MDVQIPKCVSTQTYFSQARVPLLSVLEFEFLSRMYGSIVMESSKLVVYILAPRDVVP